MVLGVLKCADQELLESLFDDIGVLKKKKKKEQDKIQKLNDDFFEEQYF